MTMMELGRVKVCRQVLVATLEALLTRLFCLELSEEDQGRLPVLFVRHQLNPLTRTNANRNDRSPRKAAR